jgi:hypothetical protein
MAGGTNSVRDTGKRDLQKYAKGLDGGAAVLVGVQGKEAQEGHQGGKETVGEIASRHELGLGVPERSWLRDWVDENRGVIRTDLRNAMTQVLRGRLTKDQAMEILGVKYVGLIQTRIANGIEPPNAPSTIARKGSSTPLIDTGQLRSAVTYILEQMLQ